MKSKLIGQTQKFLEITTHFQIPASNGEHNESSTVRRIPCDVINDVFRRLLGRHGKEHPNSF
jgi:hypothetical protein